MTLGNMRELGVFQARRSDVRLYQRLQSQHVWLFA
jgi:hypothetical protein